MNVSRRDCFVFLLLPWIVSSCWANPVYGERRIRTQSSLLMGVSLAGPEFGAHLSEFSNERRGKLGKEYTMPRADTLQYFSRKGIQLIRLPFRWERIQPRLGERLDAKHLAQIKKVSRAAQKHGLFVILDVHNYGRYRLSENGQPREYIIDEEVAGRVPVSRDHFADLWKRLTLEFRADRAVVGYGLMNEPHDMGTSDWKHISQTAVDVIRKIDRETAIVVSGDDWSSAERFSMSNGEKPWIRDPANHVVYEAHCYFDQDGSGKYHQSYAEEAQVQPDMANRGVERVKPFLDWCQRNHARGLVGEFGTPADPEWREVTKRFLDACREANVGVCYWAAGEWWGDYPLSIHPKSPSATAPQLRWLQAASKATD